MSVVTSATIQQSSDGSTLTFTDTSTGLVAPIARTLTVFDPYGTPLTSPTFSGNVATITISADGYYSFQEQITDANGSYSQTENILTTGFYELAFAQAIGAIDSPCDDVYLTLFNLNSAESYKAAAITQALYGFGVTAQLLIIQANFLSVTPYYA